MNWTPARPDPGSTLSSMGHASLPEGECATQLKHLTTLKPQLHGRMAKGVCLLAGWLYSSKLRLLSNAGLVKVLESLK